MLNNDEQNTYGPSTPFLDERLKVTDGPALSSCHRAGEGSLFPPISLP